MRPTASRVITSAWAPLASTDILINSPCFDLVGAFSSEGKPSKPVTCAQADVTDNCDGTYALQFALPLAGRWQLSASVAGEDVPWPQAAALKSVHAPLTAEECEISGVDGIVSCGTSDPIFVQVPAGCSCPVLPQDFRLFDCSGVTWHVTYILMSEHAISPFPFTAAG